MKLVDVGDILEPTKNPNTHRDLHSVTKGLVYYGLPIHYENYSVPSVCCIVHGAMLAVANLDEKGMLYRCEVCNNGCIKL